MTDTPFMDYLTNLESPEGQFLWLGFGISFFVGFLIAWLLRGGKISRLEKELADSQKQRADLQTLLTSTEEQLKERNLELQEESRARVALMDRMVILEREKEEYITNYEELQRQVGTLETSNRSYVTLVDTLNNEISELKATGGTGSQPFVDTSTTETPAATPSASAAEVEALKARLNQFEARLGQLSAENQSLKTDLETVKSHTNDGATASTSSPSAPEPSTDSSEPTPNIQSEKSVLYDKIIVPDREADDLTQITGVGDFMANKLNGAGIFSYEQIANWTPEQIDLITTEIGYLPGRIQKDDWVGQAARLMQGAQPATYADVAPVVEEPKPKAPTNKKKSKTPVETDLKVVEGIGPKIEEVLKKEGIMNWTMLSGTEPGRLREILEAAGGRFRMHNPYTWPLQARLAAAGRWDELKDYQDELKGGRE